jgi:hypothetical protein
MPNVLNRILLCVIALTIGNSALAESYVKRALITREIDEPQLVTLKGNTRPEANAQNDLGAVADDFPMGHMLLPYWKRQSVA